MAVRMIECTSERRIRGQLALRGFVLYSGEA
jgi:hypothetical protein